LLVACHSCFHGRDYTRSNTVSHYVSTFGLLKPYSHSHLHFIWCLVNQARPESVGNCFTKSEPSQISSALWDFCISHYWNHRDPQFSGCHSWFSS
jgi:hypothetical protein